MSSLGKQAAGAILAVGVVLGGLGAAALMQGAPKAEAQAEAKAAGPGRYQVSAFAYGYGYAFTNTTSSQSKWGAYVVDTQTGDLYLSTEGGSPRQIGRVGEK